MKMRNLSIVNLLPLLVSISSAAPLERRQSGNNGAPKSLGGQGKGPLLGMASKIVPIQKAMKIEEIKPQLRQGAKRIRITYGPYQLRAANSKESVGNSISMDPAGTSYSYMAGDDFPRDVTVLFSTSQVVDEKFQRSDTAKGIYNHHNVFFDYSRAPPPTVRCSDKPTLVGMPVSVFMAGATEQGDQLYTTGDGKFNSGFYLGKNDTINFGIDVVNYNNEPRTVYTVSEMEYVPGKIEGAMQASQQIINLGMCSGMNGADIHPPPGQQKFTIAGKGITIAKDGYWINTRGHLHDGGLNMRALINGVEACNSKAVYGGEGATSVSADGKMWTTIKESTVCDKPIKVSKGDKLEIVAYYDMDLHPARESAHGEMAEAMALLIVTFAESL